MKIEVLKPENAAELTAFLMQNEAEIVQFPVWGDLQKTLGGRTERLIIRNTNDKIIAAAQILVRRLPLGFTWLSVARAPVFAQDLSTKDVAAAWQLLQKELAKLARKELAIFARYDFPARLPTAAMAEVGRPAHASHFPAITLLLDLQFTESELLAQMKPKGRYNLKVADKHGVIVVEKVSAEAAEIFVELLQKTTARDGFAGHAAAYYHQFLVLLASENLASCFVAEHAGRPVAAILVTWAGARATYYYGASDHAARASMAPYAVQWAAIRAAKARGCRVYDFLGIAPEDAAKHALAGVTRFKKQFGGRVFEYAPSREVVYRPLLFAAFRLYKKLKGL